MATEAVHAHRLGYTAANGKSHSKYQALMTGAARSRTP